MDGVDLASGVLLEEEKHVSHVVENMPEIVDRVHEIVLGIISVLHSYDVIKVGIDVLTSVPTVESDWVKLLGDFGHQ